MSGFSSGGTCPSCEGEMITYQDYKPFDNVSGDCLECGFSYYTKTCRMTLAEVNEQRSDIDLEPLTELVKGEDVWGENQEVQNA